MTRRTKVAALVAVIGTAAGVTIAVPSADARPAHTPRISVKHVVLDWAGHRTTAEAAALAVQPAAATPIQDFTRTINDGGTNFNYTMIGKDAFVVQAKPSTRITTYLQPVKIRFPNGHTWDPTVGDSCDATSAVTRTERSPVFVAQDWAFGGTSVGKAQYIDAVQRAGFYKQTKPTGINPGYHVKLIRITLPKITVDVPNGSFAESNIFCGNGKLGAIDIGFWDNLVQNTLLPNMAAQGLTLKDLPLFLFGNVVMFDGSPGNCCILGYHYSKSSGATFQSYANSMYNSSGLFSGAADVSILTHEVSEWLDDPNGVNLTKGWGNIGQVSGCQFNLETGDPLTGTSFADTLNGKTYHLQELAFYSWFYHQNPSQGVNGWFSNRGKFAVDAEPCP